MSTIIDGDNGINAAGIKNALSTFILGQVIFTAGADAPTSFLKCNGAAISRTIYAGLFAVIGTTYGAGDGTTTFNVPDLRGEFIRGLDDGRGIDSARVRGSAQTDTMQGHKHDAGWSTIANSNNSYTTGGGGGSSYGSGFAGITNPISDGSNGTPRTAAETRPRNVALLACIFTGV